MESEFKVTALVSGGPTLSEGLSPLGTFGHCAQCYARGRWIVTDTGKEGSGTSEVREHRERER